MVKNEGLFNLTAIVLFVLSLLLFKRVSRNTTHPTSLGYKWCKFGRDRSTTKGTLLREQSIFSVWRLLLERLSVKNAVTPCMLGL